MQRNGTCWKTKYNICSFDAFNDLDKLDKRKRNEKYLNREQVIFNTFVF